MLPLYPDLDSSASSPKIRLIEIRLDDDGAEICCKFHIKNIEECAYIALSYTWGEEPSSYKISLNGHDFNVRPNLYRALSAIRKRLRDSSTLAKTSRSKIDVLKVLGWKHKTKAPFSKYGTFGSPYSSGQLEGSHTGIYLWIDAISINQQDLDERREQVQLMSRIYSSASVVLAWLGTHDDSEELHATIACLESTNIAITKKKESKRWPRPTNQQRKVMEAIAGNSYWTRLWIVQELMLAQRVLVQIGDVVFEFEQLLPLFLKGPGNVTVNWTFSHRIYGSNWRIEDTSMGGLLWQKTTLQDHEKDGAKVTIPMLLTLTQKQECSDRRDKVYGLLGLIQSDFIDPNDKAAISADYSISNVEVYAMVLLHVTTQHFGSATSILHLCWKAASSLAVPKTDPLFVSSTAEFLAAKIGIHIPSAWGRRQGDQMTMEEIKRRVERCRWSSSSLDDVVYDIVSEVSKHPRTFVARPEDKNQ